MTEREKLVVRADGFRGDIGVARRDITPPVGIYARQWGAARHDVAEGVHRPLTLTALVLRDPNADSRLVLLAMDGGWFKVRQDEENIRGAVVDRLGMDPSRVILTLSHTHAACSLSSSDAERPGGHLIAPYLETIAARACEAAKEATASAVAGRLIWSTGRCDLAVNRDLPDPDPDQNRFVVGFNPAEQPEDTLVVGRATRDSDDACVATIVNYACHPTTLAWENRLISPDYVGAAREVVESATGEAPMLFLQGASGELSPAHQYTGDTAIADRHGARLGYAVLSTLQSMEPAGQGLRYTGARESGATLGIWATEPYDLPQVLASASFSVALPIKPMPSEQEIEEALAACEDRVLGERLSRQLAKVKLMGSGPDCPVTVWLLLAGNTIFVGLPHECYSRFQRHLRRAFPDHTVIVMNLANGASGSYLYPPDSSSEGIYQVWVSPFTAAALPELTDACVREIGQLIASVDHGSCPVR
jgi:hypothetical protein